MTQQEIQLSHAQKKEWYRQRIKKLRLKIQKTHVINKDNRDPRTDPCGTPTLDNFLLEQLLLNLVIVK